MFPDSSVTNQAGLYPARGLTAVAATDPALH